MTESHVAVPARRLSRRAFLASTAAASAVLGIRAIRASAAIDESAVTAYLSGIRSSSGIPAIGAAIASGGNVIYAGGAGVANLESKTVEDAETVFLIASISKTMSAVAVMQLVRAGKAALDDPIQKYAPWFPVKQAPITVRHLMTHTSGIHHYLDSYDPEDRHWTSAFVHYATFEESTRFWRNDPLLFTPGTAWLYSTFGVALLQAVVETASGQPFEEYLKENIWTPAGMTATELDVSGRSVPHRDQGYLGKPPRYRPALDEDDSYKYAAGGVLSTDRDLCLYGAALNAGKLLDPGGVKEMYRLQLAPDIPSFGDSTHHPGRTQALIWQVHTDPKGRRYVAHSGSGKGTISVLIVYPDRDLAVSVHRNSEDGPSLPEIALHLADLV